MNEIKWLNHGLDMYEITDNNGYSTYFKALKDANKYYYMESYYHTEPTHERTDPKKEKRELRKKKLERIFNS